MSQIAQRYAQALFEVAEDKNNTAEISGALAVLGEVLSQEDQITKVLGSPLVASNDKIAFLKNALDQKVPEELTTFLQLLAKNSRLDMIPHIVRAFQEVLSKKTGILTGIVHSATELNDLEKSEIKQNIESKLSQKVELNFQVKKEMIGGIEAKVGSYIFEDSIKSHMQKLNDFINRSV